MPRKSPYHYLVVPLWYFPVAAIGYACFAYGVVRGIRRAALNACVRCGYDLARMIGPRADRVCPECGQRQGESTSRRGKGLEVAVVEVKALGGEGAMVHESEPLREAGVSHSGRSDTESRPSRE